MLEVGWGGIPGGTSGKKHARQSGRQKRLGFNPRVGKIPWRRAWQPTPVFLPGEFHGQRSLTGCSRWGHRESDTTEWPTHTQPTYIVLITPWSIFETLKLSLKVWNKNQGQNPQKIQKSHKQMLPEDPWDNIRMMRKEWSMSEWVEETPIVPCLEASKLLG